MHIVFEFLWKLLDQIITTRYSIIVEQHSIVVGMAL